MKIRGLIAALVLTAAVGGTVSAACAARLTPLVVGWEQFFKLDWESGMHKGRPVVSGHILNDWGFPATRIQLLVEGLDATGRVESQKVAWLGATLTPGMRAYFEVPVDRPEPAYRVSVFAFDWVQRGDGIRR